MTDFAKARRNMVDCQIHPSGVIEPAVLQVFETLPRESFVPEAIAGIAYNDEDIVLPDGRLMLEPQVHARMLQLAAPAATDICLVIGDGNGYASATLGNLVSTVIAVATNAGEQERIGTLCERIGVCNVVVHGGALETGAPENAPYNLIFVNGAVAAAPEALQNQLEVGGRLVYVLKKAGDSIGRVVVTQCMAPGQFSSYQHFDAATPYIPEFKPKLAFSF